MAGKKVRPLTSEERKFVESQYIISKSLFEQGKYSECIFELQKIFKVTDDYKKARQIESLAKEGLAKLEEINQV